MGVLLNRRRYMGASKQAKTLFEMYNQYFDGTVNSIVDTGLKLWDGTHNRWKMEVEYDAITAQYADNITLFAVKPDYTPYSGIRVRKDRPFSKNSDFTLTIGEACTVISNPGEFSFGTSIYGSHLFIGSTNSVNSFTLIRDGQYLYCDFNGQLTTLKITDPKTNNLNLLIGCDYQGANNGTQRYYTGTIQKFVITELPPSENSYIQSGLIFQLDGWEKGNKVDQLIWTDLKGGIEVHASSPTDSYIHFEENYVENMDYNHSVQSDNTITLPPNSDYTVEICVIPKASAGVCFYSGTATTNNIVVYANLKGTTWQFLQRCNGWLYKIVPNNPYTISANLSQGMANGVLLTEVGESDYWSMTNNIGLTTRGMTEKLYAVRIYNRRLTQDEMLFNQRLDNQRFNLGLDI